MQKIDYKNKKNDILGSLSETLSAEPKTSTKTRFERVKVSEINLDPKEEFPTLFPINEILVHKIADDMENNNYDEGSPVYLAKIEEEPENDWFLIDGHHRRLAAIEAGIEEIPCVRKIFDSRKQAKLFAYHLQIDRRNVDDAQKYKIFKAIDEIKNAGRKSIDDEESEPVNTAAEEAEALGVSARQISKMRNIKDNASEETVKAVEDGSMSINQADKKTNEEKKKKKAFKNDATDNTFMSDSLEDNSGNPMPVMIHQPKIDDSPHLEAPEETELDRWTREKNIQVESAKMEGHSDGFYKAFFYVLAQVKKGRTPEEIYQDVPDFSPSKIYNFVLSSDDEDLVLSFSDKNSNEAIYRIDSDDNSELDSDFLDSF